MKPREDDVELLESREEATNPLQPPDQPLDFVAPLVQLPIVCPRVKPALERRHYRVEPQGPGQLAGLVPLLGPVPHQRQRLALAAQAMEQLAAFGCIMGLARRQRDRHRGASLRGHPMTLGGPPSAGLADGLRPVWFNAPVPSGGPFTLGLSIDTASSLSRTSCSFWRWANTRSRTPVFDQRVLRV